jgi:hypothetical protein
MSEWNKVVVSLVVVTAFFGTSVMAPSVGRLPDVEPMADDSERTLTPEFIWDMNGVNWKDADSTYTDDLWRMMYAGDAVMWNPYDYTEFTWYYAGYGQVYLEVLCYGLKSTTDNFVLLEIIAGGNSYWRPHQMCYDYGRRLIYNWYFVPGYENMDITFRFWAEEGFIVLSPNPDWTGNAAYLFHSSKGEKTFEIYDMRFNKVDSCYYLNPDCHTRLNMWVHNHVAFLNLYAYLQTRTFTPSKANPDMKIILRNKCLSAQCSVNLWVNGRYILTHQWPSSTVPALVDEDIGTYLPYSGTSFYVQIRNNANSEFVWDQVTVDVL